MFTREFSDILKKVGYFLAVYIVLFVRKQKLYG